MKRIIILALVIITVFACKDEQQATRDTQVESKEEFLAKNKLNIPKKGKLKNLTATQKKLVEDWLEFTAVLENMKLINSSTRFSITEDLGQLAANIDVVEKKKYPENLDATQIRSRFLVLKTIALKLQDDASDESFTNDSIAKRIVEINKVFNAVCYQIERTSKSNIAPEEILGDAFKELDSTTANVLEKPKKQQLSKKIAPKKPIKEIDPEDNIEVDPENN
ncbi:hypothetical protein [Kordia sp.]|uniref:hypothetical protein n=1 Tax=Kordia sp. TaxID=1965332 RepID=UPI003B5BD3E2